MRFMMSLPAAVGGENFAPKLELAAMRTYSDEMRKAGVLLLVEGLGPGSNATRISVLDGKRVSTEGPFLDVKETLAGFWLIEVKSREEALAWAGRCPLPEGGMVEIRPVLENPGLPPEPCNRAGKNEATPLVDIRPLPSSPK